MRSFNLVRVAIGVAVAATSSLAASQGIQPSPASSRDATAPGHSPVSLWNSDGDLSSPGTGGGTLRVNEDSVASSPGTGGGTLKPLGSNGGRHTDATWLQPMAR